RRRAGRHQPGRHLRVARRRLARPGRDRADRRGRVRRRTGRGRRPEPADGGRRDRPGGGEVSMSQRVVVTGTGAVTPLGVGGAALLDRWCEGTSGIEDGVAACRDFDPLDFLSRKEARRADRFTQLAIAAAEEALAEAGWDAELPYAP